MSDEQFINKCEVCRYFNGTKNLGEPWNKNLSVDCDLGMNSTLSMGCSRFYPVSTGCLPNCYLRRGQSLPPNCGYFTHSLLANNSPCYEYAKIDFAHYPDSGKKGCFLSTAACKHQGLPDNCFELETLRNFRDTQLLTDEKTISLVSEYYRKAPELAEKLSDNKQLSDFIFSNYIIELVSMIENKQDKNKIIEKYEEMFSFVQQQLLKE